MELMDRSLDQLYKLVYEKLKLRIPESVVGKMAEAVRSLYKYLACDLLLFFIVFCLLYVLIMFIFSLQIVKALHFLKANLNVLHRGTYMY